jgi:hypothetical protein
MAKAEHKINPKESENLSDPPDPVPFLGVLKDAVLPLAIYLYFTGFMYVYSLYHELGIGIGGVDIPVYYLCIYAINVFRAYLPALTLALIIVLIAALLISRWQRIHRWQRVLATTALVLLFPGLYALAYWTAERDATAMRKGQFVPTIRLTLRPTESHYPDALLRANDKGNLHLVLETNDRYYVLDQPYDEGDPELALGTVYGIAKLDVALAQVTLPNIPLPKEKP